jgi:hypothetical protein
MSSFNIINSTSEIPDLGSNWEKATPSSAKYYDGFGFRVYSRNGSSDWQDYRLSKAQLVGRGFLGVLAVVCSLGSALLSENIHKCLSNLNAKKYILVQSHRRELSEVEIGIRRFLGALALTSSLGLALLSPNVRNLFSNTETRLYLAEEEAPKFKQADTSNAQNMKTFLTHHGAALTPKAFKEFLRDEQINFESHSVLAKIGKHGNSNIVKWAIEEASQKHNHGDLNSILSHLLYWRLKNLNPDPKEVKDLLEILELSKAHGLDLNMPAARTFDTYSNHSIGHQLLIGLLSKIAFRIKTKTPHFVDIAPTPGIDYRELNPTKTPEINPYIAVLSFLIQNSNMNEFNAINFGRKEQSKRNILRFVERLVKEVIDMDRYSLLLAARSDPNSQLSNFDFPEELLFRIIDTAVKL